MSNPSNSLEITPAERKKLRATKIRVKEIHRCSIKELQSILQSSKIRAMELSALSEFQSLPSIGIRFAHDLISMGYYSLRQLKGKDGARLTDAFEKQNGVWIDPCVEDQFRLVAHYANNPQSHKNWWDFTAERKAFRQKNGYPATRPTKPWFILEQYQSNEQQATKKELTKKDIRTRLRKAIQLMNNDLSREITLKELAEAAHLSAFHFLRCFRSTYSRTPVQYLQELRLKHASKRLRQSKLPMSFIINNYGFKNESSFIRSFKRRFRVTPSVYRKS